MAHLVSRVPPVRKAALIPCVASALALVIPAWNATQSLIATTSTHALSKWWIIPTIPLMYLFTAIMPVFYFALYRNEGTLRIPKRLRLLGIAAAIVFGITVAAATPGWIRSLEPLWAVVKAVDWRTGATSLLTAGRNPWIINPVASLVNMFSNVVYILLLIALSRHAIE